MPDSLKIIPQKPLMKAPRPMSSFEVLKSVVIKLRDNLQVKPLKEGHFGCRFIYKRRSSCEGTIVRSWMYYRDPHVLKMKTGCWVFAFGEFCGTNYGASIESDIVLVRMTEWPVTKELHKAIINFEPSTGSSNGNNFRFSFLANHNKEIVQNIREGFDLTLWARDTFAEGQEIDPPVHVLHVGDTDQPFSTFLPASVKYDEALVAALSSKLAEFMLSN
jgi:hypothetical protein